MKAVRVLGWLVVAGLAVSPALAGEGQPKTEPTTKPRVEPEGRAVFGGPFMRLKGLPAETRTQLAALWADVKQKEAAAEAAQKKALEDYSTKAEATLDPAQKEALTKARADREARMRADRERKPPAQPTPATKPKTALRVPGPLAALADLTEEQVKKINDLAATRELERRSAVDAMQAAVSAAEKAFAQGVEVVLTDAQKAALKVEDEKAKAAAEKAKADREAEAKKRAEEQRKRTFGGDFRVVKDLSDGQQLNLGRLWQEAQAAVADVRKAADAAREDYVTKGRALLPPEQLKALEELEKKPEVKPGT